MSDKPDQLEHARLDVQRTLMDRARRMAERQDERLERPRLVGFALALAVVVVVLFAFDRFLGAMQRYLDLPVVDPERAPAESIPAYVVPLEPEEGESAPVGGESPSGVEPSHVQDQRPPSDAAKPGGN
jgi:hypothetical protein